MSNYPCGYAVVNNGKHCIITWYCIICKFNKEGDKLVFFKYITIKMKKEILKIAGLIVGLIIGVGLFFCISFKTNNEVVSGIVYNTSNDRFLSGATCFSVRASEDAFVREEDRSSYCIPKDSQYKELVNRAAADKNIKVVVKAGKYFTIKKPWSVYPNVVVEEIK